MGASCSLCSVTPLRDTRYRKMWSCAQNLVGPQGIVLSFLQLVSSQQCVPGIFQVPSIYPSGFIILRLFMYLGRLSFWTASIGICILWLLVWLGKALARDRRVQGEWGRGIYSYSSHSTAVGINGVAAPSVLKGAMALHLSTLVFCTIPSVTSRSVVGSEEGSTRLRKDSSHE